MLWKTGSIDLRWRPNLLTCEIEMKLLVEAESSTTLTNSTALLFPVAFTHDHLQLMPPTSFAGCLEPVPYTVWNSAR